MPPLYYCSTNRDDVQTALHRTPHPRPRSPTPCPFSARRKGGRASENHEALSWAEYRQALSELSPAFRRHGIGATYGEHAATTAGMTPVETSRSRCGGSRRPAGAPPSPNNSVLAGESYRDPWDGVLDRTTACSSPPRRRCSSLGNGDARHLEDEARGGGYPPRSPGADSYGVLRRKRHAAVSLDYEEITKQLPQVGGGARRAFRALQACEGEQRGRCVDRGSVFSTR